MSDRELHFEASGALLRAGLVMRDRETDSWWSIMTSDAIGGPLEGTDLLELPHGEKTTWGDWVARYPDSLVLSVEGREHVGDNPYDNYFRSDGTFRGLEVADDRLPAKESVFTFWLDGQPWAVPHRTIEGGAIFEAAGRTLLFHRGEGESFHASSDAFVVPPVASGVELSEWIDRILAGDLGDLERLPGFDTFWYSWVAVNVETRLLE